MIRNALAVCIATVVGLSAQNPRAIADRAYEFGYPLVLMELTRQAALSRATLAGTPEPNRFAHAPAFPDDKFRQVIRPNADTLYSSAWLDLTKEPLILRVPDTKDRYYVFQFMDAWTETFSAPGKRTTGTGEGVFAVTGPGWKGTLPASAQRIEAPTNMVWLLGRIQTNGAADYPNVHAMQRGFVLMPLSLYPDGPRKQQAPQAKPSPPRPGTPPEQVRKLSPREFFALLNQLMRDNPPHAADAPFMKELAGIGVAPGVPFEPGPETLRAVEEGVGDAVKRLAAATGRTGKTGPTHWSGGGKLVGRYGTEYRARAVVARIGLGANPPEDAVYLHCDEDAAGKPLDGSSGRYQIHFAKGQTPPVKAFWSVTMYNEEGYFVPNPIRRYTAGDRDPLVYNSDGSLDLYVQAESPAKDKEANWLPSPVGPFNLSLRLYWPSDEILSGKWIPPAVTRLP